MKARQGNKTTANAKIFWNTKSFPGHAIVSFVLKSFLGLHISELFMKHFPINTEKNLFISFLCKLFKISKHLCFEIFLWYRRILLTRFNVNIFDYLWQMFSKLRFYFPGSLITCRKRLECIFCRKLPSCQKETCLKNDNIVHYIPEPAELVRSV